MSGKPILFEQSRSNWNTRLFEKNQFHPDWYGSTGGLFTTPIGKEHRTPSKKQTVESMSHNPLKPISNTRLPLRLFHSFDQARCTRATQVHERDVQDDGSLARMQRAP
jgi:hypothetical protein